MAALIVASRSELPKVRERFLRGLSAGEDLFLTIRIPLPNDSFEQAFVKVVEWSLPTLKGTLASGLLGLPKPKRGDTLLFEEERVVDWTITGANGDEEGNRLGHYLEGRQ